MQVTAPLFGRLPSLPGIPRICYKAIATLVNYLRLSVIRCLLEGAPAVAPAGRGWHPGRHFVTAAAEPIRLTGNVQQPVSVGGHASLKVN
jgi:hypothetical protein